MRNFAHSIQAWAQRHRRPLPAALALALLYNAAITVYRDYRFGIVLTLFRVAVFSLLLVYGAQGLARRRVVPFAVWGALFSFFIVAMRTVITEQGVTRWSPLSLFPFLFFAVVYTLCACGLSVLLERIPPPRPAAEALGRRVWLAFFLVLVVCWLPVFLVMGPLRVSPDSAVVIGQAVGGNPWDDSHPILYTALVSLFLRLGQLLGHILIGAYLFGFAQLCAVAAALSFSLYWLRRQGAPLPLCGAGLAYFVLTPVFALNAITLWKDIPFNCCLLLLAIAVYAALRGDGAWLRGKTGAACFLSLCAAVCFFRGNGLAIVVLVFLCLLLALRPLRKRLLLLFVPFLLAVLLVRGPVYAAFGISRLGAVEAAALPLQQVGRVAASGAAFTQDQVNIIENFVPIVVMRKNYTPTSPDPVKKHPAFNAAAFEENSGAFVRLWLQLMPQHLEEYTNAWLLQTVGYWKYDFPPHAAHLEDAPPGSFGVKNKDVLLKFTGVNLRGFFSARAEFFSMGLLAFAALYAAAHLAATRRCRLLACLAPLLAVWAGLMAGAPTYHDLRYMLVFALGLPVLLFLLAAPGAAGPVPAQDACSGRAAGRVSPP